MKENETKSKGSREKEMISEINPKIIIYLKFIVLYFDLLPLPDYLNIVKIHVLHRISLHIQPLNQIIMNAIKE
jgi:hypothetical protein